MRFPISISLSGSHIPIPGPLHSLSWSIGSNLRLGGLRFGGKSRILCYPATSAAPQFMRLLQGTDISEEHKLEPPAPIFPWGCGHWAVFCSSTENLRQLSKNLPTTNSATITIWEGFLDICC